MSYPLQAIKGKKEKIICFESYGVRVGISSEYTPILERLADDIDEILPTHTKSIENKNIDQLFNITRKDGSLLGFSKNGEFITGGESETNFLNFLLSRVRLTVAESADRLVFVHAGVVVWRESAIVIPGRSYSGKTTLVAEMIKRGAEYFSDEYAVLDANGLVHPFPKTLSIRGIIDEYQQVEFSASEFGGETGTEPRQIGMILLCEYDEKAEFNPKSLTSGEGILKIIEHTIPIRVAPEFSLMVLQKATENALIWESKRGEAEIVVNGALNYLDKSCNIT
jgi:hypothetical protein